MVKFNVLFSPITPRVIHHPRFPFSSQTSACNVARHVDSQSKVLNCLIGSFKVLVVELSLLSMGVMIVACCFDSNLFTSHPDISLSSAKDSPAVVD